MTVVGKEVGTGRMVSSSEEFCKGGKEMGQ